jgi:surface antigen
MRRLALMLAMIVGWAMFEAVPVLGQVDGAQLNNTEQQATMETFQYALEKNKTDQAAAWVNPDTQASGSVVPVRTYQNEQGQNCREYVTTITVDGQEVQGYGTACRQPDGTWMIVSGESPAEGGTQTEEQTGTQTLEQTAEPAYPVYPISPVYLYPYGYPYWYLDYPYFAWDYYYPGIYFSYNIIYFSGHYHYHYYHHTYTRWYDAHRWHHVDHAANFHQGKHYDYPHSRGNVPHSSSRVSGAQHFQGQPSRSYTPGSSERSRQFTGVRHFNRTRQSGGVQHFNRVQDRGQLQHFRGTRHFDTGRHGTTSQSFRGRTEMRGFGAFHSFSGRMVGGYNGGYHGGTNFGGGFRGGGFHGGGHR